MILRYLVSDSNVPSPLSSQQEHGEGEAEIKAAQAKGYVDGAADQITGYKVSSA